MGKSITEILQNYDSLAFHLFIKNSKLLSYIIYKILMWLYFIKYYIYLNLLFIII